MKYPSYPPPSPPPPPPLCILLGLTILAMGLIAACIFELSYHWNFEKKERWLKNLLKYLCFKFYEN